MIIYGYFDEGLPIDEVVPQKLAEITLNANPSELRKIAHFLAFAADEMEATGYEHWHLADKVREFKGQPHFVVMNPDL